MHRGLIFVICIYLTGCYGYKFYQSNIPNGGSVPHPCKPNYIWKGVGHQNVLGGGKRNPFGAAFKAAGGTWTAALCRADSDQDGKTNGEELGDPNCVWSQGAVPKLTVGLSHPGVCEPTNSTDCIAKNSWDIDCSEGADFTCDGIADPETLNVTLKFDRTRVPANETTYICQSFKIPADKEYHLIATKPVISNQNVMHHTLVYGCAHGIEGFDTPKTCGMAKDQCRQMIGGWTLGSSGDCQLPDNGIKVGKGSFSSILIEHHWNNPTKEENYYDESGMTLFLTPRLRKNNIGFLITGQTHLVIPPRQKQYTTAGVCKSSCLSRKINSSMYITSAHLHMHYLGSSGSIEQWRDGALLKRWFFESEYSYDTPITNTFNPPLEVKPTDEIRTVCHFNSENKNKTTTFGEATSDEMCFGFMNYYPAELNLPYCISHKQYGMCEIEAYRKMQKKKQEAKQTSLKEEKQKKFLLELRKEAKDDDAGSSSYQLLPLLTAQLLSVVAVLFTRV